MSRILVEDDLHFDFSAAVCAERLDEEARHKLSHCMKRIDFLVEWEDCFWLVEVKNPTSSKIPQTYRYERKEEFFEELTSEKLFAQNLGPKLKDSFLYLHLTGVLPPKPLKYFVFIGLEELDDMMLGRTSSLLAHYCCLAGPDGDGWQNRFITEALIFNERSWNKHMSRCPVRRVVTRHVR